MGEIKKNSYGKIYSDLSARLWKITEHYDLLQIENEYKYESTLHICILQNLLTQFNEVMKWKNGRGGGDFKVEPVWENTLPFGGLNSENVRLPQVDNLKVGFVLEELRNILSHPFPLSSGLEYTSDSENGLITSYSFIGTNTQTNVQTFLVVLTPQEIRVLVFELSKYLSGIADDAQTAKGTD
jgi:hypothetical protein